MCGGAVVPGRKCCLAHQDIEEEYGGPIMEYRLRAREVNERADEWVRTQNNWMKIRKRHRFGKRYCHGFFFGASTCGMIKHMFPMYDNEGDPTVCKMLSRMFPEDGEDVPCYVFYDRACQILRHLRSAGVYAAYAYLDGHFTLLVDRFHFQHHARLDLVSSSIPMFHVL